MAPTPLRGAGSPLGYDFAVGCPAGAGAGKTPLQGLHLHLRPSVFDFAKTSQSAETGAVREESRSPRSTIKMLEHLRQSLGEEPHGLWKDPEQEQRQ